MAMPFHYHWKSLFERPLQTSMAVGGVALATGVFLFILGLVSGLSGVLGRSGDPNKVLFLRGASLSETQSALPLETARLIETLEPLARGPDGEALASAECAFLVNLEKREVGPTNVIVRGIGKKGIELRPSVKIVEGRWFEPGPPELCVSRKIAERFENCELGGKVRLSKLEWTVVGVFDASDSPSDSEIWADRDTVSAEFLRDRYVASVLARLADSPEREVVYLKAPQWGVPEEEVRKPEELAAKLGLSTEAMLEQARAETLVEPDDPAKPKPEHERRKVVVAKEPESLVRLRAIADEDKRLHTKVLTEDRYFRDQQGGLLFFLAGPGSFVAIILAIGAAIGAANTFYASVASRSREIGTLRAMGFRRRSILATFTFESALLGAIGGAVACLVTYLVYDGVTTGTANWTTFAEITFAYRIGPGTIVAGMVFGAAIGIVGGLLPAIRAARLPIVSALRAV
jgi:hypothetical protein